MTKIKIKDILLENFKNAHPFLNLLQGKVDKRWYGLISVKITEPSNKDHMAVFYLMVCSPEALEKPLKRMPPISSHPTLVQDIFDMKRVKEEIVSRVAKIHATDWESFNRQMEQYFTRHIKSENERF